MTDSHTHTMIALPRNIRHKNKNIKTQIKKINVGLLIGLVQKKKNKLHHHYKLGVRLQ